MQVILYNAYMKNQQIKAEAARIFQRAAAYIRKYGWQEEGMGAEGQPRCSMGALASAHSKQEWNSQLSKTMYETLYSELAGLSLTQYNHKFRNGEKVARLYEQVAERLTHDLNSQGSIT